MRTAGILNFQTGKNLLTSNSFGDITLRAALANNRVVAGDWTGDVRVFALSDKPDGKPVSPAVRQFLAQRGLR